MRSVACRGFALLRWRHKWQCYLILLISIRELGGGAFFLHICQAQSTASPEDVEKSHPWEINKSPISFFSGGPQVDFMLLFFFCFRYALHLSICFGYINVWFSSVRENTGQVFCKVPLRKECCTSIRLLIMKKGESQCLAHCVYFFPLVLTVSLQNSQCLSWSLEKAEAQRDYKTCLRTHS